MFHSSFLRFIFNFPDILNAFGNATHYSSKWAKAWHTWALFNTAVMSQYTVRGLSNKAAQFVVSAVTGYFHSIACAANAKGVDDSLQVIISLDLEAWCNIEVIQDLDLLVMLWLRYLSEQSIVLINHSCEKAMSFARTFSPCMKCLPTFCHSFYPKGHVWYLV